MGGGAMLPANVGGERVYSAGSRGREGGGKWKCGWRLGFPAFHQVSMHPLEVPSLVGI